MPGSRPPLSARVCQAPLSSTAFRSLLRFMSTESVMLSNHLILCHPLLLCLVFPSIEVFSSESIFGIRWPEYWSFSFSISSSNEYSRLISFRIEWFDFLAVQGTLKSLLQHHNLKASVLQRSAAFVVQLHVYTFFFIVILHSRLLTVKNFSVGKFHLIQK